MTHTADIQQDPADGAVPDNPFPGSDKDPWPLNFSAALSRATGLPREITDGLAPYVVRPKDLLTRHKGQEGLEYWLKPEVIKRDPGTGLDIMDVVVHGFTGSPGEHNERIRGAFHSPARHPFDPAKLLPRLVTGKGVDGLPTAFLTTEQPVPGTRLSELISTMNSALDSADGFRNYRLQDDMAIYGQNETTLHALLLRTIAEPDGFGGSRVRRVLDLPAIKGANRSRARLKLHGLSVKDIIFGVDRSDLVLAEGDAPAKVADPAVWVPAFADALRAAYGDPRHRLHERAHAAARIATIRMQIIVGSSTPDDFHNVVFEPNRADHRRPPLGYTLVEKTASDLRAVLRDARKQGLITEEERAWLASEGPDPHRVPDEDAITARDRRDRALFAVVFPRDPERAKAIRRVLGEPARTSTSKDHVWHRLRMVSSAVGEGYQFRWNPRVLDGLISSTFIKNGEHLADEPAWTEVLGTSGEITKQLLEKFLTTRGIHWLAEQQILQADRGSIGAQNGGAEETDGETLTDKRIRRSVVDARRALLRQPRRTIALMHELARASLNGDKPRQVDGDGVPVDGTRADKYWFDNQFPREITKRTPKPTNEPSNTDSTPPHQPEPSAAEIYDASREAFYLAVTSVLPTAMVNVLTEARELLTAAHGTGRTPLHQVSEDELKALHKALYAAQADLRMLKSAVADMQVGATIIDASESERFLTQAADEDAA
ncbi:hypothetical protein [Streptosporangium roseum]|uniref:hypothetical protein n=1 Tax=Streptosporangium roseum TaxID=2001 RepID=UPI003334007D